MLAIGRNGMAEMVPFDAGKKNDGPSPNEEGVRSRTESEQINLQTYTNEEVSEIIRVGLKNAEASHQDTVSHEEMLAIGRDFGLNAADITNAFSEISRSRVTEEQSAHAGIELKLHALMFVAISAFLFFVNALTSTEFWWAAIPTAALAILFLCHAFLVRYVPEISNKLFVDAAAVSRQWADSRTGAQEVGSAATFQIPDLYHSLAVATGIARVHDDHLHLEFETRDTIFGALKSELKEVRVPLEEIANVRLERIFWSTKLTLQSHRLKSFEHVPGHKGGQIVLVIDPQTRAAAEQLAEEIATRISQSCPRGSSCGGR